MRSIMVHGLKRIAENVHQIDGDSGRRTEVPWVRHRFFFDTVRVELSQEEGSGKRSQNLRRNSRTSQARGINLRTLDASAVNYLR